MPSIGFEAGYQLNNRFSFRAGAGWAWIFSNTKATAPSLSNPVLLAALHYQIRKRLQIKAEIRHFALKSAALPETQAKSQNLQIGLGLVWKPW